jgi:hypothetical protein
MSTDSVGSFDRAQTAPLAHLLGIEAVDADAVRPLSRLVAFVGPAPVALGIDLEPTQRGP